MKIKLDRTLCDGFGVCAKHAPDYFSLDDWGYASLVGNGDIPEQDQAAVTRAVLDCPVHAILKIGEYRPADASTSMHAEAPDEPQVDAEDSDAEWFVR
jgi:ferredoxin